MKLPSDNLGYPIKIELGSYSGSGFLTRYNGGMYLVTARHVVFRQDPESGEFTFLDKKLKITCYPSSKTGVQDSPKIYDLDLPILHKDGNIKFNDSVDLVIIRMGTAVLDTGKMPFVPGIKILAEFEGSVVTYLLNASRKFESVEITNEVYVLGYPNSLSSEEMSQLDYNAPLVRKGIVAGKNKKNKTIILDCPVYGGNSGGMVLEINEQMGKTHIHLIGVVTQFVPYVDQWQNTRIPSLINRNYYNSGYSIVVPVDFIYELIRGLDQTLPKDASSL